ncbi:MAG: glycosyltransferase [Deltaproteobacteria bacterium]|nr:glycosyltransferase [Deltaproteobacteria bacterium]
MVPTYREVDNLPLVAEAVEQSLADTGHDYELLFIDDDSNDGSEEICAGLSERLRARMVVRRGERGLATAVIHGIAMSSGDIIVVMDADLSHPPSAIPKMVKRLLDGESDFVLGSRYVEGGSIHDDWSLFRKLNSVLSSLLARPLCPLKDPMSRQGRLPKSERSSDSLGGPPTRAKQALAQGAAGLPSSPRTPLRVQAPSRREAVRLIREDRMGRAKPWPRTPLSGRKEGDES